MLTKLAVVKHGGITVFQGLISRRLKINTALHFHDHQTLGTIIKEAKKCQDFQLTVEVSKRINKVRKESNQAQVHSQTNRFLYAFSSNLRFRPRFGFLRLRTFSFTLEINPCRKQKLRKALLSKSLHIFTITPRKLIPTPTHQVTNGLNCATMLHKSL